MPAIVSTAVAMSTSSKTTTGALPPSSRWTRLSVSAAARATALAGLDRAGERDHVDVLVGDERLADVVAADDDVEHALGQELGSDLGQPQRSSPGSSGAGLRTIVLPVASAGPIFQTAIISG